MSKKKFVCKVNLILNNDNEKKASHAAFMRKKRKEWTEEERLKNAEQAKERMRKYRERKKQEAAELSLKPHSKIKTRLEEKKVKEQKSKEREYKQKYRAKLSSQKKRRIREKDAASKRAKRAVEQLKNQSTSQPNITSSSSSLEYTGSAFKKAIYRAKKKLPKTPQRFAAIMKGLVSKSTPRTKRALESQKIFGSPAAKKNLNTVLYAIKEAHESLKGRTKAQRLKRKEFVGSFIKKTDERSNLKSLLCKATGIKRKYLQDSVKVEAQKKRKDALTIDTEKTVEEFYFSNACYVPDKKATKKDKAPTQVLTISTERAWRQYCSSNPTQKVSYDKFCKLRPNSVLTQKHRKLYQCLCEYCENIRLKLCTINKLADKHNLQNLKLKDEFESVSVTMCEKDSKFHKLICVDRQCQSCGVKNMEEKLKPLCEKETDLVTWSKWDIVKTSNPKTGKDINKRMEVKKQGTVNELITEFVSELNFLSVHLFEAFWQQHQFKTLKDNMPQNTIVLIIDFAENYSCFSQNEVQGAHWAKDSVTIHPCLAYYQCPDDSMPTEDFIDIISNDLCHDSHAVNTFMKQTMAFLKNERKVSFEHAIVISDGCAAQYKSKIPFMDVSCSGDDHGVTMERCFYGSRHGKNRCDGEAAVLKSFATRIVKNGQAVIADAESFFTAVKTLEKPSKTENVCSHKRRAVIYVTSDEINRVRPDREVRTLAGTRKLHSVRSVSRGILKTRRLSCFCPECRMKNFDQCQNSDYVDTWNETTLKCLYNNQPNQVGERPALVLPDQLGVQDMPDLPAADRPMTPDLPDQQATAATPDQRPSIRDQLELSVDMDCTFGRLDLSIDAVLDGQTADAILNDFPQNQTFHIGEFVMVNLPVGKRTLPFVAEIKEVFAREMKLQYMTETSDGFFKWPTRPDVSIEPLCNIKKRLSLPILDEKKSSTRTQFFKFV